MQQEIKWLCPDCIPAWFWGQTRHLGSITSLLPVFHHYFHYYYLLDHHYYIHYYTVITALLPIITVIMSPLLLIITSVITLLLLIITSVITSLFHTITMSLLPIFMVIMDPILPIITRSIIGNNGSIITSYWPGQLGDGQSLSFCHHWWRSLLVIRIRSRILICGSPKFHWWLLAVDTPVV